MAVRNCLQLPSMFEIPGPQDGSAWHAVLLSPTTTLSFYDPTNLSVVDFDPSKHWLLLEFCADNNNQWDVNVDGVIQENGDPSSISLGHGDKMTVRWKATVAYPVLAASLGLSVKLAVRYKFVPINTPPPWIV